MTNPTTTPIHAHRHPNGRIGIHNPITLLPADDTLNAACGC